MTNQTAQQLPNIPLDPAQWEVPTQKFVGRITISQYQTTDDAHTREGQSFTEFYQWPRAGRTFHIEVERLDAVYVNKETGEQSPIKRYQTLGLERYDTDKHVWRTVTQGDNKNNYILDMFMKAGVRLADPAANEGMVCEFQVERTHKFNGNIAKNLLYPIRVLAKPGQDYEYRDTVELVEFDPAKSEGAQSLDQAASEVEQSAAPSTRNGATAKADMLDEAGVLALLVGIDPDNEDAIGELVAANKAKLAGPLRTKLIGGTFVEEALEAGKLVVVDEVYALA